MCVKSHGTRYMLCRSTLEQKIENRLSLRVSFRYLLTVADSPTDRGKSSFESRANDRSRREGGVFSILCSTFIPGLSAVKFYAYINKYLMHADRYAELINDSKISRDRYGRILTDTQCPIGSSPKGETIFKLIKRFANKKICQRY